MITNSIECTGPDCPICKLIGDTVKQLPFYVKTNTRIERFATIGAAQLFMELHCEPWCKDSIAEKLIETNVR